MPKRSTGCFECRKRKVRCDEGKPECKTCLKRGTKCPGYRPTQSFVLHAFDEKSARPELIKEDENRYKYSNHAPAAQKLDQSGNRPILPTPPSSAHSPSRYSSSDSGDRTRRSQANLANAPLPQQVSPVAIERVQHIGTFLELYMPQPKNEVFTPPTSLMFALPNIPAAKKVFSCALDALSAAQLTVSYKNYPLINRARSLYGTALGQMMKTIMQPGSPHDDYTLLATYLLTLYEVFVGVSQGHGFFYHVQGLLHILNQRGPASIRSKLAMDTYHGIRYNSLSLGYHLRKASMLDTPEWLAVTAKAAKVDPYVALIDICISIPRLLERTDKLTRAKATAAEFEEVINDSQTLADRGFAWFASFQENHGPLYTNVPIDTVDGFFDPADKTYDPVYAYKSFAASNMCSIYWMSMLIMRSNMFLLVRTHRKLEPKQLFMWDRELSGFADSICRGVPFSCRPAAGYVGRFGQLTPLIVARKYYTAKGAAKEAAWCEKVYYGAKVPGLYSPPQYAVPLEQHKGYTEFVQNTKRYI
ncbi:hypothetical protein BU24DRAFT_176721 [Aaosphaeria arxii CBS 175.79]|uniref:Zn(2)-C6 fungal-type domain-containing protein n=1 Tax=Aaosphaeria arxii CBS 175.79 TaxID=1450172 RepID=A0A6A5XQE0_9PLEO|nr:uncharacterized protein BU24DRAFT_176721 [Aaosphaeria arxii CBS 175.79]KAF2015382.1 hypothetical protein BU24DRAFT_176721 [Aaosphaeria arxii CBS 175.79]